MERGDSSACAFSEAWHLGGHPDVPDSHHGMHTVQGVTLHIYGLFASLPFDVHYLSLILCLPF